MRQRLRDTRILRAGVVAALGLAGMLLAVPATALAAYAPWVAQTSGTTQTLNGVAFGDATTGWAVGGGGTIRRTENGGTTWAAQPAGTTQALNDVTFVDATTGWAVGNGGVILRTTNGGAKWTAQTSKTTQALNGVAFTDASNGWAVGGRGIVLHTTNGGSTWTAQTSGSRQTLYGVACADASTCWAVGNKGAVLRTVNAGANWTTQSAGTKTAFYTVGCSSATTAWIGGNGGAVRTTTNGGGAWTPQTSGTSQALRALVVQDASRLRFAGSGGTIRVTSVGGTSWAAEASGTTQTLYGIAWRGTRGWAVGSVGTVLTYRPDTAAPTTTAAGLQADDHSGWRNTPQTVTLAATDTGRAGVAATCYTVDGGGRMTYSAPFSVSGQGRHTVAYWSVDAAGNVETENVGYVNIDTTTPSVGHDADAAWHATDVTVHLTAADDPGGSGVAATQYRAAGSADWLVASGNAFIVAAGDGDGARTYDVRAVDAAGNESTTGACTVKIDAMPATTTATNLGADKLSAWSTGARTVSLVADDGPGSGVASVHYSVDGIEKTYTGPFIVDGVGQHKVEYWSVDNVGHVEAVRTGWVNIAAFYAQSQGLAPDLTSSWYNGTATVTITAGGGVGPLSVCYTLDGGAPQTVTGSATFSVPYVGLSGVNHHTIVFWALDGAAESTHQTGYVNIDVVKPVTAMTATPAAAPLRWVNRFVTLTYLATDNASGVASTFSSVNGVAPVSGTSLTLPAPADHSGDGRYTVAYWSTDKAGNAETAKSVRVRIDTRHPTTRTPYAASVVRGSTAKLRFIVKDTAPCAGKAKVRIVVKNSHRKIVKTVRIATVKTGLTSVARFRCTLARGTYKFFVYATDRAGNKQSKIGSNRLTVR